MRARNGNIKFEATTGTETFDFSALDRLSGPNGVGFGIDYINPGGRDRVVGTSFDDSFTLSAGTETIDGGSGVDTVVYQSSTSGVRINLNATVQSGGFAEGDQLSGIENVTGSQNHGDSLIGNSFANVLSGLGGNDTISGGGGNDTLMGGEGNDVLTGGIDGCDDMILGGAGIDTITYVTTRDMTITLGENGAGGTGVINPTSVPAIVEDRLFGIENVLGGQGNDTIAGNSQNNRLEGGAGTDAIDGGSGDDIIIGGSGQDFMTGGSGADVFVFRDGDFLPVTTADGWTSFIPDGIRDFERGVDMIDLRGYDANTQIGGDQGFHVTTGFTGNAGELAVMRTYVFSRGDTTTTSDLWGGDTNGDGQADFCFSVSGPLSTLTPSDFLL